MSARRLTRRVIHNRVVNALHKLVDVVLRLFKLLDVRLLKTKWESFAHISIAVFDNTGYFHAPEMIGMESVYDKMCYFPEGGEITEWDFSRYIPDAVVFALGQNDPHNGITNENDIDIYDSELFNSCVRFCM